MQDAIDLLFKCQQPLNMLIESVLQNERSQLLSVAVGTGLFTPEEAEVLLGQLLDDLACNAMPPGHQAVCCRSGPGESPMGWSYLAPDEHETSVWNLWWLGVSPSAHGKGIGALLLRHAEQTAALLGGRLLVIETSAADALGRARRFYSKHGYLECGRIPDFYSEGEAKVILARRPRTISAHEKRPRE